MRRSIILIWRCLTKTGNRGRTVRARNADLMQIRFRSDFYQQTAVIFIGFRCHSARITRSGSEMACLYELSKWAVFSQKACSGPVLGTTPLENKRFGTFYRELKREK